MRHFLLPVFGLVATLLFVVGSTHSQGRHASTTGPAVLVAQDRLDLGRVEPRQHLVVAVTVHNTGSRRLVLVPEQCCGGQGEAIVIPPNASTNLPLDGLAAEKPGRFTQTFRFTTNDPSTPILEFEVVGEVALPPYQPS